MRPPAQQVPLSPFLVAFVPEHHPRPRFRGNPVIKVLARATGRLLRGCAVHLSRHSVGLVLNEPVGEGALLALFPPNPQLGRSPALTAEVTRVERGGFASWCVGCELLRPLSAAEVRDFLA
jgi:hypothetical protein